MEKYDLIVIGTGPASSTVASKAAEQKKSTAIIEAREFGGTCALRGCNPKKVYTNAGMLVERLKAGENKLIEYQDVNINWPALYAFKQNFTESLSEKVKKSYNEKNIETILGQPEFTGKNQLVVNGRKLEAKKIFIGCGAKPITLNIEGEEYATLSDEFMELEKIPQHVTFIGGGYISMEFAHVVSRAGCKVTIVDRNPLPLKHFDPDLVKLLCSHTSPLGVEILTDSDVVSVKKMENKNFELTYEKNGETRKFKTNLVVHGAGRKPALKNLNLEKAGVKYNKDGIEIDKFMRSVTNTAIYSAGDCVSNGQPRLTPVANEEARSVAFNIFSDSPSYIPDLKAIPSVVFTSPSLASIGLSEKKAKEENREIIIHHENNSDWSSVRKLGLSVSGYKILVDKEKDTIIGAHLLGPVAEETINIFALAMKFNLTATDIKSTLFTFPTFSSDVRNML